jgi:hypothetical protein
MSMDWQKQLANEQKRIVEAEKKQAKEAREREKAERLRADERMRLAYRLMNKPPPVEGARVPVNRRAAMLLQKASPYAQPPPISQKQQTKQKPKQKDNKMSETSNEPKPPSKAHPAALGGNTGIPKGHNPEEYVNLDLIAFKVIEAINNSPHKLTELARAAIDARGVLDDNMKTLGKGMELLQGTVKVALEDVRQTRFAFVAEVSQMLSPLKELRAFLLDNQYETEIKRLREFCDLCERLQKLKADGTLDVIADTIIRLAVS